MEGCYFYLRKWDNPIVKFSVTVSWPHGVQYLYPLQWRHNGRDGVSNHQPLDCLLKHWIMRRWKKTPKPRVPGFVWGIHRWPVNSPHKGPVARKMLPFEYVIMFLTAECTANKKTIWTNLNHSMDNQLKLSQNVGCIHSQTSTTVLLSLGMDK